MLNQLVESKNNAPENKRKGEFFITTLGILLFLLVGSWTYSLYAKDYAMGGGELELSSLVAPVAVEPETPPAPEPEIKPERTQASKSDKIILKDLYDDLANSKNPPKNVIGEKDIVNARQFNLDNVQKGDLNVIPTNLPLGRESRDENGCGLCENTAASKNDVDDEKTPVVVKPTPVPTPKILPPKSLGVVNGIAANLVKPTYPAAAKAVRAEGAVNVQVLIDEKGSVISATAVSGHVLLRAAAVSAARQSKFTPTFLSNQPVKVTGVIVYNFKVQ